jgi:hypothetical protein
MKYDFLAIGDITTDVFITIDDAEVAERHGENQICFRFGDKVPFKSAEEVYGVGNSPNAGVSVERISSPFLSFPVILEMIERVRIFSQHCAKKV